jgi:hypothetical protein
MTKPVSGLTAFATLPPPWSLQSLDTNNAQFQSTINSMNTYANPVVDTSGAANVITAAIPAGLTAGLAPDLLVYVLVANTTTATAVTFTLGGLAAKNVVLADGSGPPIGSLKAGGVYPLIYNGTAFQVVGPLSTPSGTFTATYTDGSVSATRTAAYQLVGKMVTLFLPAGTVSSSSGPFQITGLPAAIQPATIKVVPAGTSAFELANVTVTGVVDATINISAGRILFSINGSTTWTGTGNKGLQTATNLFYTLD